MRCIKTFYSKAFLFVKKFFFSALIPLQVVWVQAQEFRAPAYPLITHDPYFSIWSFTDTLTSSPTRRWTGTDHSLTGLLKVDGNVYRFMGMNHNLIMIVNNDSRDNKY